MSENPLAGIGITELAIFAVLACIVIVPIVGGIALLIVLNRRK